MKNKNANDAHRKIDEIMNKRANKTQVGWTPTEVERKEGAEWTDANGKQWTKKNGLTQSVTKLYGFKTPWWCPKCDTPLNGHHLRAYKKSGACYNCMEAAEMKLKQSGEWKKTLIKNGKRSHIAWLTDKIQELQQYYDNVSQPEFMYADNEKILMIEKWDVDLDTVKKDLEKEIQKFKSHLIKVELGEYDETNI